MRTEGLLLAYLTVVTSMAACGDPVTVGGDIDEAAIQVVVTPFDPPSFTSAGEEREFTATVIFEDGSSRNDLEVLWSTTDQSVASVDSRGVVRAVGSGEARVQASFAGISGDAPILVQLPVRHVVLTPDSLLLSPDHGGTVAFRAEGLDASGDPVPGVEFSWSMPGVLYGSIEAEGLVTGIEVALGPKRVVARLDPSARPPVSREMADTSHVWVRTAFSSLSGGSDHNCAIGQDGGTWCWGWNFQDRLGRPQPSNKTNDSAYPLLVTGGHRFVAVEASTYHSCGMTGTGDLRCWGGDFGATPVLQATGTPLVKIRVANKDFCGLSEDGLAYCWGANEYGTAGDGMVEPVPEPALVSDTLRFQDIELDSRRACGLRLDGTVICWGSIGMIGSPPQDMEWGTGWADLSMGGLGLCGARTEGGVWCSDGAIHPGAPISLVSGSEDLVSLDQASYHRCGLTEAGEAMCWGFAGSGQLGNGDRSSREYEVPQAVVGGFRFTAVALGTTHSCGLTGQGAVACWGNNANGQTGTSAYVAEPTIIFGSHR